MIAFQFPPQFPPTHHFYSNFLKQNFLTKQRDGYFPDFICVFRVDRGGLEGYSSVLRCFGGESELFIIADLFGSFKLVGKKHLTNKNKL
ncbi:hypothetical protein, partial [Neisseria animalis]|uniref:hypothetical protein n=1 Tax=Neisseria animalis TaxID=492 RepID=UPI000F9F4E9C